MKEKIGFSINLLVLNFKVEIQNQHVKINPSATFKLNLTKVRTRTENGISGLL